MIQSFRESMKNTTVVVVVVLFFIVPMVLTGVGNSFLSDAVGDNVASVGSTTITSRELARAMNAHKQRMISQSGVDASSEFLKDENLRGPILQQLTVRAAIIESLKDSGMGISDDHINETILGQEQFYIDGKFNAQAYRRILASAGYTPTTYKSALSEDMMLAQLNDGINATATIAPSKATQLLKLLNQKRSFDVLTVSQLPFKDGITVSDEEAKAYFDENSAQYMEPQKISVDYLELDVDSIKSKIEISDAQVEEAFIQELAEFAEATEYKIAHILLDPNQENYQSNVDAVKAKLSSGVAFEQLVTEFSVDRFSKGNGGDLGVLDTETYSDEFNDTVFALEVGQVSDLVESDIGAHFVKLTDKVTKAPPILAERKEDIRETLRTQVAEDEYVIQLEQLKELVYSAQGLTEPAQQLGLDVKTSKLFDLGGGLGQKNESEMRLFQTKYYKMVITAM